ncbi:MAG: radical SAM protein [Bacteroidota bacterium]
MNISFTALTKCNLCPRNCLTNRFEGGSGYCKSDYQYQIGSVVVHQGEEPAINGITGICNIFFSHCNMQCVFCQNYQISENFMQQQSNAWDFEKLLDAIEQKLNQGCGAIGFVSPSHQIPQMVSVIRAFEHRRPKPIFVYNSNGYDKVEVLKELEGMIDIYLPDLKYADNNLALQFSDANDYWEVSRQVIKEMYRQKGAVLHYANPSQAEGGLIIRHLVLPNHTANSIKILQFIAEELSPKVHVSLMSQYFPNAKANGFAELSRVLSEMEYKSVVQAMENLGLENGWLQELGSHQTYQPDFNKKNPFSE